MKILITVNFLKMTLYCIHEITHSWPIFLKTVALIFVKLTEKILKIISSMWDFIQINSLKKIGPVNFWKNCAFFIVHPNFSSNFLRNGWIDFIESWRKLYKDYFVYVNLFSSELIKNYSYCDFFFLDCVISHSWNSTLLKFSANILRNCCTNFWETYRTNFKDFFIYVGFCSN